MKKRVCPKSRQPVRSIAASGPLRPCIAITIDQLTFEHIVALAFERVGVQIKNDSSVLERWR